MTSRGSFQPQPFWDCWHNSKIKQKSCIILARGHLAFKDLESCNQGEENKCYTQSRREKRSNCTKCLTNSMLFFFNLPFTYLCTRHNISGKNTWRAGRTPSKAWKEWQSLEFQCWVQKKKKTKHQYRERIKFSVKSCKVHYPLKKVPWDGLSATQSIQTPAVSICSIPFTVEPARRIKFPVYH